MAADQGDAYAAALEATIQTQQREIASLRADLDDERGMKRGYRRLLIECLRRSRACPLCNPVTFDSN